MVKRGPHQRTEGENGQEEGRCGNEGCGPRKKKNIKADDLCGWTLILPSQAKTDKTNTDRFTRRTAQKEMPLR